MIIRYDKMMSNFESLMEDVFSFIDSEPTDKMMENIKETANSQRQFTSSHRYELEKFGLTAERIKKDCSGVYQTFLD